MKLITWGNKGTEEVLHELFKFVVYTYIVACIRNAPANIKLQQQQIFDCKQQNLMISRKQRNKLKKIK